MKECLALPEPCNKIVAAVGKHAPNAQAEKVYCWEYAHLLKEMDKRAAEIGKAPMLAEFESMIKKGGKRGTGTPEKNITSIKALAKFYTNKARRAANSAAEAAGGGEGAAGVPPAAGSS